MRIILNQINRRIIFCIFYIMIKSLSMYNYIKRRNKGYIKLNWKKFIGCYVSSKKYNFISKISSWRRSNLNVYFKQIKIIIKKSLTYLSMAIISIIWCILSYTKNISSKFRMRCSESYYLIKWNAIKWQKIRIFIWYRWNNWKNYKNG